MTFCNLKKNVILKKKIVKWSLNDRYIQNYYIYNPYFNRQLLKCMFINKIT